MAAGARLAYAREAIVRHPTVDDRRTFLRKIRATNRWSAVRKARDRGRPELMGTLALVPVLGVALARREALGPMWKLQRSRLEASGLSLSRRWNLQAMSRLYFVVSYAAGFARIRGWLEGRRLRQATSLYDGPGWAPELQSAGEVNEPTG